MEVYYSDEKNVQILIALLHAHGIKRVIASPGTTNISFVASVQHDPFFQVFSCVDERSAAYLACGMAAESGEAVVLSCTGATASRNYMPGLTEAYYRKLPILAVTSTQHMGRIGQNVPQVIDRTQIANDVAKLSIQCPTIMSETDRWACEIAINKALLELKHNGGGPVHINLVTTYSENFGIKTLPSVQVIERFCLKDKKKPTLKAGRVGIVVGNHKRWKQEEIYAIEKFCEIYKGVVICDHTSNYSGKYKVLAGVVATQLTGLAPCRHMDVMIDIGDVSGAYLGVTANEVWRVNPDGEVRDTHHNLRYVFEMDEQSFFEEYVKSRIINNDSENLYYKEWVDTRNKLNLQIPELPFSNAWIAQKTAPLLPKNSELHLGILNSLRTWNFFDIDDSIEVHCNTGGFGIDGCVSSLIGASLVEPEKIYFGVVGDLAFFYDMNSIGNRHLGANIRLMVINNGRGTEFRNFMHQASKFGAEADEYIAAAGHFGKKSNLLLKHYAEDLGFIYMSAESKDEFQDKVGDFITAEKKDKSVLFEIFTESQNESDAIKAMYNLDNTGTNTIKKAAKKLLRDKNIRAIKKIIGN